MDIEQEILEIKRRNARVSLDKQWEQSWLRRLLIMGLTYIVAITWLYVIHESNFWWKAVVPVAGYLLSTLSLFSIKQRWMKN